MSDASLKASEGRNIPFTAKRKSFWNMNDCLSYKTLMWTIDVRNVYAFVLPVLEVIILEVLLEPRLTQVDSGAYPRGGRLR